MNHSSATLPPHAPPAAAHDRPTPALAHSRSALASISSPTRSSDFQPPASLLLTLLRFIVALPARTLLAAIWLYQRTLSPALPVVLGPSFGCRFAPTCSHYGAEALRTHGAIVGTWLTLCRLLKCTPLHPGGLDPVPPRASPRCVRLTARAVPSRS